MKNILELSSKEKFRLGIDPNASSEILAILATDKNHVIRTLATRHSNTSPDVLEVLATDDSIDVRCAVAMNPNTPEKVLFSLLLEDKCFSVVHNVTQNPNITELMCRVYLMRYYNYEEGMYW